MADPFAVGSLIDLSQEPNQTPLADLPAGAPTGEGTPGDV
jgi:hypothetical protein